MLDYLVQSFQLFMHIPTHVRDLLFFFWIFGFDIISDELFDPIDKIDDDPEDDGKDDPEY